MTASDRLPGRAVVSMLVVDEEMSARTTAVVMIAWTVASRAAGGWSLLRRDTP